MLLLFKIQNVGSRPHQLGVLVDNSFPVPSNHRRYQGVWTAFASAALQPVTVSSNLSFGLQSALLCTALHCTVFGKLHFLKTTRCPHCLLAGLCFCAFKFTSRCAHVQPTTHVLFLDWLPFFHFFFFFFFALWLQSDTTWVVGLFPLSHYRHTTAAAWLGTSLKLGQPVFFFSFFSCCDFIPPPPATLTHHRFQPCPFYSPSSVLLLSISCVKATPPSSNFAACSKPFLSTKRRSSNEEQRTTGSLAACLRRCLSSRCSGGCCDRHASNISGCVGSCAHG